MILYYSLPGNGSKSFERKCRNYDLSLMSFKYCRIDNNDGFRKVPRAVTTTEINDYSNYDDLVNYYKWYILFLFLIFFNAELLCSVVALKEQLKCNKYIHFLNTFRTTMDEIRVHESFFCFCF